MKKRLSILFVVTVMVLVFNLAPSFVFADPPEAINYFYIENLTDDEGTVQVKKYDVKTDPVLKYSADGTTWEDLSFNTPIDIAAKGKIFFYGIGNTCISDDQGDCIFSATVDHAVGGDISTLLNGQNNVTELTASYAFNDLFYTDTKLKDASKLILPATTLSYGCYSFMFNGCKSLTSAPALNATTLAGYCYENMFSGCTSLESAPALPATTLASYCYKSMFSGSSLKKAPALNATALAEGCCQSMFSGCSLLESVPALPANSPAYLCYDSMFSGCSSLENAPALPATELAKECYARMFTDCTSLKNAPALPAMTLAEGCYEAMFAGCSLLENAPALPATELAKECYAAMFVECLSLKNAPDLPATSPAENCYNFMFAYCPVLNKVSVGFTAFDNSNSFSNSWLEGVAEVGEFYAPKGFAEFTSGANTVPEGWTVIEKEEKEEKEDEPEPPKMSDNSSVLSWLVLMLISGCASACIYTFISRRNMIK